MNVLFPFQQKNWFQSFLACRNKGLDLASVENEEEHQALLKLLIPIGEFVTELKRYNIVIDIVVHCYYGFFAIITNMSVGL